jgi:Zn-dependent protease
LLFVSVLAHELSHCIVARRLGIPVRQVTLFIFGGVSEMAQTHSSTPGTEFRVTIAGPLSSIAVGAVFAGLASLAEGSAERIVTATLQYLYFVNFLLAAFNLLPGFPLDGGRVLRSYLWHRNRDLRRATRSAAQVGSLFAVGLMVLGFISIISMNIIVGIWLILIGMFLRSSAEAEYKSFEVGVGLQDMKLREIMTPPIAVTTSMPISQFVSDYVFHYHLRIFPAVENHRFAGMIDVRSLKGIPPVEWPSLRVGDYLSNSSAYCVLDPDIDATDALRLLVTQNCDEAPIVRDGILLGMLTRADLFKLISLKGDLAA